MDKKIRQKSKETLYRRDLRYYEKKKIQLSLAPVLSTSDSIQSHFTYSVFLSQLLIG
jgi:hypothetical protein